MNILGVNDSLVLFQSGDNAVVIDKDVNLVIETGNAEQMFSSSSWTPCSDDIPQAMFDLAQGALADLSECGNRRMPLLFDRGSRARSLS